MAPPRKPIVKGYRMLYRPGHPLSPGSPYIPEHRVLLWEKIGPGTHPCHYCEIAVTWMPGSKTRRGALVTDHVDRNPLNNDPINLVPCCHRCNVRNRTYTVGDDEDFIVRPNGTRLRGKRRTCEQCGDSFVAYPSAKGRFCSASCAGTWTAARRGPDEMQASGWKGVAARWTNR